MPDQFTVFTEGFAPSYNSDQAAKFRQLWLLKKDASNNYGLHYDPYSKQFVFSKRYPVTGDYVNLVTNGDFSNGTTGWSNLIGSTASVSGNTLSITGNGGSGSPGFAQSITVPASVGRKIYYRAKLRITNSSCSGLTIYLKNESDVDVASPVQFQNAPTINTWYEKGIILTTTSTSYSSIRPYARHSYADAATANGKVMEVQNVFAIDLTATFGAGNEPTKEWCDANLTWNHVEVVDLESSIQSFSEFQAHNILCEQSSSGMAMRILKNGSTIEKITNENTYHMPGDYSLYKLTRDVSGNEADAYGKNIKIFPNIIFSESQATELLNRADIYNSNRLLLPNNNYYTLAAAQLYSNNTPTRKVIGNFTTSRIENKIEAWNKHQMDMGVIRCKKDIVLDGLVLWLEGEDFKNSPPSATWKDRSPRGNHATASGFAYTEASGSDGQGGVKFDGVDDCFVMTQALDVKTFFVDIIFSSSIDKTSSPKAIIRKTKAPGGDLNYGASTSLLADEVITVSAGGHRTSVKNITIQAGFHQIVWRDNGSSWDIFLDGVKQTVATAYAYEALSLSASEYIGRSGTIYLDQKIKRLLNYNRALTDEEIQQNYQASL